MCGHELRRGAGKESARREGHFVLDDAGHGDRPDLPLLHGRRPPFGVVGDTYHATDGEAVAPRRSFARVPSVLRAAVRPRARRPARSPTRCTASRRCSPRCSPTRSPTTSRSRSTRRAAARTATSSTPSTRRAARRRPTSSRRSCPLIHEVLDALEIQQLQVKGVEADDVIATLATRAADDRTSTSSSSPATATRSSS